MKLSDLKPSDIASVQPPPSSTKKAGMRLSDLDPSEIVDVAVPEEKGLLSKTLEGLDRYGAAPLRAAYGKAQDSMLKKGAPLDVVGAAKAAYDQFGDDPEKAPTAAQLVEQNPLGSVLNKQGFKESFATHPTAVGLRGLMAPFTGWDRSGEIVGEVPRVAAETLVAGETDPISYIPGAVIERPLVAAGKQVAKVAPGLVNRSAGAAEFFTGVPKESWKNYITRNKQVKDLEKTFGPQVQDAADSMREGWNKAIKARKDQLGLEIEQAVMAAPKKANISTDPILAELNNVKMGLNPNIPEHLAAMNEIDQHIQLVKSLGPEGKLTARDAFDLQKTLQGRGRKAYSVNGALFNPSPQSAKAARDAAALTRKSVNKAMPGVAKANEAFSALHDIDDTVRPSLLTPGKSNAGLMGAVGKIQNQDTVALRDLGDWLGKDLVGETRDFATYKHMQGLGADAADKTGKAVYRAMMGGLVGAGGGYASSEDAKIGLIAGGLAGSLGTNPKLWRAAMDAGIGAKNVVSGFAGRGGLLERGAEKINPTVRALEKRLQGAGGKAKEFIKDEEGAFSPDDLFKILKPGEENVFDLKKARGMAGEPKGLLPGEGDAPVAKYRPPLSKEERRDLLDWIDSAYNSLRRGEKFKPVDEQYLREVLPVAPDYQKKYVRDLLEQIEKQKTGGGEEISKALGGRPEIPGVKTPAGPHKVKQGDILYRASNPDGGELRVLEYDPTTDNYLVSDGLGKSWRKSDELVASKDAGKGLLTSLDVERGPVKELPEAGEVVANVRPTNSGMRVDKIAKPASLDELERAVLGGEPLSRQEVSELFALSQKTGPASERAHQILNKHDEILARMAKEQDIAYAETQSRKKAAEAERLQKGLIGVDFGGRGGKMPKAKIKSATAPEISREELAEQGRQWLSELDFGDIEPDELIEQLAKMSDDQILKMVNKHWDGGMRGFEEAMNASLKPAPPKKIGSKPKKKK